MKKSLVIANWKCNPITLKEAKLLFDSVKRGLKNIKNVEVVVCPPFPYLSIINNKLSSIKFGAQDTFWEEQGAFTGEISALMLKDLGCQYVILGHSERRKYFVETDEAINKKIKAALKAKLKAILCVGETQKERKEEQMPKVILSQIKNGLSGIPQKEILNITIAYEPIWAIGTGKTCSPDTAMSAGLFIKKVLNKSFSAFYARNVRIVYGGSVNSENVNQFISEARLDGVLVGGASLKAKEFINLVKNVNPV